MRKRTHIFALIMVFAWFLCGCVSVHMGEVVKRGEPTVKRVEEVTRITDVLMEPTVGPNGSLCVSVTGVAESSLLDKTSVAETRAEKRMSIGFIPGYIPLTVLRNEDDIWNKDPRIVFILAPLSLITPFALANVVTLVYDPFFGKYVDRISRSRSAAPPASAGDQYLFTRTIAGCSLIGGYRYLITTTRSVEFPNVVVQKGMSKRLVLPGIGVGSAVSSLNFTDSQRSGADGLATFAVRSGDSHYVDVEISLKDVTGSPYAKLLEAVGSKSQKFRIQLSRVGSVPLKVPDWPLESIAVIGSVPDVAIAAKVSDALADIRYFTLPDKTEMEMALQERLIDRTKLLDDSALMQRVCQTAKSDLLLVLKLTGGAVERTIVAKLVRVKTGEVIASAEAKGVDDVRVVSEVLCRAYAVVKNRGLDR